MAAQPGEPAQGQRTESDGSAVTGSPSDSLWSRPADKRCVFIKNRPATSSHRKQGLPSPSCSRSQTCGTPVSFIHHGPDATGPLTAGAERSQQPAVASRPHESILHFIFHRANLLRSSRPRLSADLSGCGRVTMTPGTSGSNVVLYELVNPDKRAGNWDTPPLPRNHLGEGHALTATFNADEARDFWGFIELNRVGLLRGSGRMPSFMEDFFFFF